MRTRAEIKSLKLMPLLVPPQAWNSQSAMFAGVPSHSTSCTNAFLFRRLPLVPADRLNASLMRRLSASDTTIKNVWGWMLIEANNQCSIRDQYSKHVKLIRQLIQLDIDSNCDSLCRCPNDYYAN